MVLAGNVPAQARRATEIGRSDPHLPLARMILVLALRPGAQAELEQLLRDQQDPASPRYHHWLTPAEFGARFGLTDAGLAVVSGWLTAHGFTIDEVAQGRGWIDFSGVAAQVEQAFATEIHDYSDGGTVRHANTLDPSIPRGLTGLVRGIVSLHSFPRPSHLRRHGPAPRDNISGANYLAPADFATIYDLTAAYQAGNDGAGQSIAIVARTDIELSDVRTFRRSFGLPANDPVFVHNGPDPGILDAGDEVESDLDTQWAGAVAPRATIKLVISGSTNAGDGADLSAQFIVDHDVAPIATTSYGLCEAQAGAALSIFYDALLAQGDAEGITSFSASGDSGAADCDDPDGPTGTVRAVDFPCSSPHNTCVGGSQLDDAKDPSRYWSPSVDPVTQASALSYIPEAAWNESGSVAGGSGLGSSGGGASSVFAKPSWQSAPGVPADGSRDVPDVVFTAAGHDGYLVFQGGQLFSVGGTSASAPAWAGLMALVVQKTASRQGNVNPLLYQLGAAQYGGGGPAVFHDVTSGSNSVPGVTGYSSTAGYDQVTGLGSADGTVLLAHWPAGGADTSPCSASATALCLNGGGRFEVTATFDDGIGHVGQAQTVALTGDTGYVWFFTPANIEALVKVLDGCGLDGHYWVFAGGLTDVNVVIRVRDSETGAVQTYVNPLHAAFQPIEDTSAFATCP